ncbi:MAG: hypothetical protein K0S76_458 [Herbinix sp.]|jgi:hypothetical protein|nr:hypothetical protein [Herbinix sp.]
MTGAIEFLRKVKAICNDKKCLKCPMRDICSEGIPNINEADLVRKVMDYRLEAKDEHQNTK